MASKRGILLLELIFLFFFLFIFSVYFVSALTISVSSPANQTYNATSIALNIALDEANGSCSYSLNNASVVPMGSSGNDFSATATVSTESNNIMFYCSNNLNDIESQASQQVFFAYDCVPVLHQVNNTECLNTDQYFTHYTDENNCYARTNLTSDYVNTSIQNLSCDFCTPTWQKRNNSCNESNWQDVWFNDSNSCFSKTGLASDINGKPANTSESCDFCAPDWTLKNGTCESDNKGIAYYIDANNCYSKTNSISDKNPPANRTYACDFCIPNWVKYNTSCENNEITEYAKDDNNCYSQTSLDSDLEGKPTNSTYLHYCNENVSITSTETNITNATVSVGEGNTKKNPLTGAITSALTGIKEVNTTTIAVIFIVIVVGLAIFFWLRKFRAPKNYGFQ